ncbi:MAG: Z-ring formation inhibitor MciZ [Dehalobacterium sp.]
MEIYVFKNQIVLTGKVKDVIQQLNEISENYHTLQELIIAHLH